jgi:hypothetical protein
VAAQKKGRRRIAVRAALVQQLLTRNQLIVCVTLFDGSLATPLAFMAEIVKV